MAENKVNRLGLGALAFGHMVTDMQTSALAVLIPILYVNFKLDYAAAALIITLNSVTSSLIQPIFGLISDRKSLRWLLPLGCLLTSLGMMLVLFMPSYWLVLLVVIISGLGSASFHPEGSRNANYVSGERKATGMSVFFVGGNIGFALGPLTATALIGLWGPPGIVGMFIPALLGFILLFRLLPLYARYAAVWQGQRKVRAASEKVMSKGKLARSLTLLITVIGFRSMVQTGLVTFIPLYFVWLSTSNKEYAAFLLSVFVFSGAIGTLIGGRLADKIDRRLQLAGSLLLVTPLLLIFLNSTGPVQVISLALAGATLISASTLTVVMSQELLPNNIGLASGLTLGLAFGAGGLGTSALGKFADVYGLPSTMLIIACLPLLVVALSLLLPGKAKAETKDTLIPAASSEAIAGD